MQGHVRQNTWESYEIIVRVHLKQSLGMIHLQNCNHKQYVLFMMKRNRLDYQIDLYNICILF
ncbi:hypothetical protein [Propionispira raffinosivorans]|uniref:hypothetical protein n=1 Tax=Propionispira raffinosivorans TaxID=86959 RepID=UPI0008FC072C